MRSVSELLLHTRQRHRELRDERAQAHLTIKSLINHMLQDLGEISKQTGGFHESMGRYAEVIERADSLESLTVIVREMVEETRSVRSLVSQTQQRLEAEHRRAMDLSEQVTGLESELRRLSHLSQLATDTAAKLLIFNKVSAKVFTTRLWPWQSWWQQIAERA